MRYRDIKPGEEREVLALVMRGFEELVRPDFSEQGAAEFERAASSFVLECPAGHHITVAECDGVIVGMIDVRDTSHICLFFVAAAARRVGVGRALLRAATSGQRAAITVNSSPWAVPVYERLGFLATGPEIEHNGIRAVPMLREPRG